MPLPQSTSALVYRTFQKPEEALALEELPLPELGPGDALFRVLAAPINPADFGRIQGQYGTLAELPAVAGMEGVAEVLAVGSDVSSLSVGDRVFVPMEIGSWREYAVAPAAELFPAPQFLDTRTAAMGWVNPATAWLLLHEFAALKPGDWIAQNAATSAVGKLVIQFAKRLGFRTANLVRNLDAAPALAALGADAVILDAEGASKAILEKTGGKKPKLALNAVGGNSALELCRCLAPDANHVTYGQASRAKASFPTRHLIFDNIALRGFWIGQWYSRATRERIEALHGEIFPMMERAKIKIDVAAAYPLSEYKAALAHSLQPGKPGKALFEINP